VKQFPIATNGDSADTCAAELLEVVPSIMRAIRTQMRHGSSVELSVPHFRTLAYLNRRRGSSLSCLAEHIGLSLPSASKLVQLLLIRGYLQREVDAADRRRSVLAPTAKGQRILRRARRTAQGYLAEAIGELNGKGRREVISAMRTLRSVFTPELTSPISGSRRR
jgi:MarR family transcriptional regulator for hemolysin